MPQTTSHLLMIRPVKFGFNTQTAGSNSFQNPDAIKAEEITQAEALKEFDNFVQILQNAGINVHVVEDTPTPHTPDSIFPNNWVSFHNDGTIFLYPMQAENRRLERRMDILESLEKNFVIQKPYEDLSDWEQKGKFLEGTGSLILDREHKIAYCCLSPRADMELLTIFGQKTGYQMVIFDALDRQGKPIYHTNVVMCVGDKFAVICAECIPEYGRENVIKTLQNSGKEVVDISLAQLENFAGNMLQVQNNAGKTYLIMSERAFKSLTQSQILTLEKYTSLLYAPLTTIENNGGGSARCMLAEVFLPEKNK